jgi:internalin A
VVRIFVTGPTASRRRLLAVIRSDFNHINASYRFPIGAFVPVWDHPGLAVEYDKLLAAEAAGMRGFPEYAAGKFVEIDVQSMLDGINLPSIARPGRDGSARTGSAVKLFVSYSHKDDRHREVLDSHLKVLKSTGLIDVWQDRRIDAGGEWRGEIDHAIEEADIMVLLVSADFLASGYCMDVELKRALERQASSQCRVVPVIVRDCAWKKSPALAALQALPKDGKPITKWPNRDTAWRTVADGLEAVISRMLD